MLRHHFYILITTFFIMLPVLGLVYYCKGVDHLYASIAGLFVFCLVFGIYYLYSLKSFNNSTVDQLIYKVSIGFVLKVILIVSSFVYIHRHFDFDIRYTVIVFLLAIFVNSLVSLFSAWKASK